MKPAKPLSSDIASSRRAQPIRQTRTNPPRSSIPGARSFPSRGSLSGGLEEKEIEIFPAITHFADAITALPKEFMRHFTLLKEVDAKIFAPEDDLGKLVDAALNAPPPERPPPDIQSNTAPKSIPMSAQGSANGSVVNGHPASITSVPDVEVYNTATAAYDPANIPRRQLFQHCAYTMQNMLVSLDEKNHVISTAAEALNKQLARIEDCFPHVELEISEEARYGSTMHWAYPENRISKLGPSNGSRKEAVPANSSAAAQQVTDETGARNDARKQAMLAKKSHKHPHGESDFDDHHDSRPKDQKKVHGNTKIRKAADASSGVGLGINGSGLNGNAPKRRKVEKGPSGGVVMEKSMSGAAGGNGTATKGKTADWASGQAPRARQRSIPKTTRPSLGPDSKKKPRGGGTANGPTRKRNNTITSAISPSLASSPIRSTFPDLKPTGRGSPQPISGGRPPSSRARQNSTQSIMDNNRQRLDLAASGKSNGNSSSTPDLGAAAPASGRTSLPDVKSSTNDLAPNTKGEPILSEPAKGTPGVIDTAIGHRKDSVAKREDADTNGDSVPIQAATVMTKSGRASKPSTPAMSSFPDQPRSRSARNALENTSSNKRSHKKGAGAAAQIIAQQNLEVDDATSTAQEDDEDEEIGADELTYCYCNGVSYGEMVACDADDCEKEWFHLECVGLKVAPRGNAKWFCNDCKERIKTKRFNGR